MPRSNSVRGGEDEDDHDDFAGMSGPGFGYRLVDGLALRDTLATQICPILLLGRILSWPVRYSDVRLAPDYAESLERGTAQAATMARAFGIIRDAA
jgi:hypothetical protein